MSLKHDSADELLDEAVARLKSMPIPDYPGPPHLDSQQNPTRDAGIPASGHRTRSGALVAVCVVLVLSFASLILQPSMKTPTPRGLVNVTRGPVQAQSFEFDAQLLALESKLDELDRKLDTIDEEIDYQELHSATESLLTHYAIPDSNAL